VFDQAQVLVTGGAGFIGSHLVEALASRGYRVRVLDDLSSGSLKNLPSNGIELIQGDIREAQVVERAVQGTNFVFHLAAMIAPASTLDDPAGCYQTNLLGSMNILRAAQATGTERVVLASSAAVYGDSAHPVSEDAALRPLTPYAASKLAMEQAAKVYSDRYGLSTICLRYFNVYGQRQPPESAYAAVIPAFISALLIGETPIIYGDGSQRRDFIYVDDVVRANLLALEPTALAEGVFNVGSGRSVTVMELAEILQQEMQRGAPPSYAAPRAGDIHSSEAVIDRAEQALGFRPETALIKGLRSTIEWFRQTEVEADS
jgi:UDP-glucose 4-epimerase